MMVAATELAKCGLVDIRTVDDSIGIDLRYSRADNVAGRALYGAEFPPLLRESTARRLVHANRLLGKHGLGLVVWDAYRPQETQMVLWHACGQDPRYAANPNQHPSAHSRGCAVDVTLRHLSGGAAAVPTGFDENSPRAAADFPHPDPAVRENLRLLQAAMTEAGFIGLASEWWHFKDRNCAAMAFIPTADAIKRLLAPPPPPAPPAGP